MTNSSTPKRTTQDLLRLVSQRKDTLHKVSGTPRLLSTTEAVPTRASDIVGVDMHLSGLQEQMYENQTGGKRGEHVSGNIMWLVMDTVSKLGVSGSESKRLGTPKSTSFSIIMVTSSMMNSVCGGVIQSTTDCFCAKPKCHATSQGKKHKLFLPNTIFLASRTHEIEDVSSGRRIYYRFLSQKNITSS